MTIPSSSKPKRVAGIDVARGIASLVMIQGHAYHGWVAPEHHDTAYAVTRVLGKFPLPSFLVLAGASIVWRLRAAQRKEESVDAVRASLVRRGLQVWLTGYVVSTVYALMDGWDGLDTFFRADVLHVIGLSIALTAFVGVRGELAKLRRTYATRAGLLGAALTLASPWVNGLTLATPASWGPLRYLVGLVGDVPGVTLMPLVPLGAWLSTGAVAAQLLLWFRARADGSSFTGLAGTSPRGVALLATLAGAMIVGGEAATPWMLETFGGSLSRAHVAVWPNVVEYAGRGLLLLSGGVAVAPIVPERLRGVLVTVGRGSLVTYVFHVPFCYGALGFDLIGTQTMASATLWLIPLMLASVGAVYTRDALKSRGRPTVLALGLLALIGACGGEPEDFGPRAPDEPPAEPPAPLRWTPGEFPEYPSIETADLLTAPDRYDHLVPQLLARLGPRYRNMVYSTQNFQMRGSRNDDGLYNATGRVIAERWREGAAGVRRVFAVRDGLYSQQDHPLDHDPISVMLPPSWVSVAVAEVMAGRPLRGVSAPDLDDEAAWSAIETPADLFGSFPPSETLHETATQRRSVLASDRLRVNNARRTVHMLAADAEAMIDMASRGPEAVARAGAERISLSDRRYFGERLRREHVILVMAEHPAAFEVRDEGRGLLVWGRDIPTEAVDMARRAIYRRRLRDGDIAIERYDLSDTDDRERAINVLEELIPERGEGVDPRGAHVWLWINGGLNRRLSGGRSAFLFVPEYRGEIQAANIARRRLRLLSKPDVRIGGRNLALKLDHHARRFRDHDLPLALNLSTPLLSRLIDENERRRERVAARAAAAEAD